jgi:hypothetical protein
METISIFLQQNIIFKIHETIITNYFFVKIRIFQMSRSVNFFCLKAVLQLKNQQDNNSSHISTLADKIESSKTKSFCKRREDI